MKKQLLSLIVVGALGFSSIALASHHTGHSGYAHGSSKSMDAHHGKKHKGHHGKKHKVHHRKITDKIIEAISHTGLSSEQIQQVKQAIAQYKETKKANRKQKYASMDAFTDEGFDEALYWQKKSDYFNNKIQAKVDLFKAIYALLTPEQVKVFSREFKAPMIKHKLTH